jgi:hypothetical protein
MLQIITMKLFPAVAIITVILCSMMMVEVIGISHFAWWKPLTARPSSYHTNHTDIHINQKPPLIIMILQNFRGTTFFTAA